MRISFTKMQGIGNDFVVIDDRAKIASDRVPMSEAVSQKICDRRYGIGADQILWLKDTEVSEAVCRMEIWNADGSTAEMCGNGIRAVALYLNTDSKLGGRKSYSIDTPAGMMIVEIVGEGMVRVDMGQPKLGEYFKVGEKIEISNGRTTEFLFHEVDMGNPHAVIFVPDLKQASLEKFGPILERASRFPNRTNVEFAQVLGSSEIDLRVWERGAGLTLACGTGACATAVAAIGTGKVQSPVQIHLPGGDLEIAWEGEGSSVFMTGPAASVFTGQIEI